jgi:pantoate kinase
LPVSVATSPAGISSFFEICRLDWEGHHLADPLLIGARGGGFALKPGVRATVSIKKSSKARISIRINSQPTSEAKTTIWAMERLMRTNRMMLNVKVDLRIDVPIGAGYGTSAAGTAATCLAFADAAQLPLTINEIGKLTHVAEVINQTGLGTASAILVGGFVLVTEPGAPGIGEVDRLPFPKEHSIICVYLDSIPTKSMLSQVDIEKRVNPAGRVALKRIRRNPCLTTFLSEARGFARRSGFQTEETSRIMKIMIANGAVGAAQNMVGKAVHGVAENRLIERVTTKVKNEFRTAKIFTSVLDDRGVRLVTS